MEVTVMPITFKTDYAGQVFGKLTVLHFLPTEGRHAKWLCKCECGNEKAVMSQALVSGATVSCGCVGKEQRRVANTSHGEAGNAKRSGAYSSWANMMMRCEWGGHPSYEEYGAKGIRVCERWHAFENFKSDMGERPRGGSIDRIDNRKGYEPGNCRWATRLEQALNTSRTAKVVYRGELVTVDSLCRSLGLSKAAVRARASRRGNDYVSALRSVGVEVSAPEDAWA